MEHKEIAEGLYKAMQAEVDGHNFYRMAAQNTNDPQGKEIFERLAKEEMEHVQFLKAQYKAFLDSKKPDTAVKLPITTALSEKSGIFSDHFKSRLKEAHYEMSALSIGIQLELSAIQFYKEQSEKVSDPVVKSFYRELADWESRHYQILTRQHDDLKEDYWANGGFSPF